MINVLLEDKDNQELVRDKIKTILDAELTNQRALATAASKSTAPWDIRVFIERTAPWEEFISPDDAQFDNRPIVNVSFEDSNIMGNSSTPFLQQFNGVFNIDVITSSKSSSTAGGHDPGDYSAGIRGQEVIRIIRNILFAIEYDALGMIGFVTDRRIAGIRKLDFQDPNTHVTPYAIRMRMGVNYNESVPEYVGEALEQLNVDVNYQPQDENVNNTFNYSEG